MFIFKLLHNLNYQNELIDKSKLRNKNIQMVKLTIKTIWPKKKHNKKYNFKKKVTITML